MFFFGNFFMKIKFLLTTSLLVCASAFASPNDKSLEELAKYASYEALFYTSVSDSLMNERLTLEYAVLNNPKMSDDDRKKALDIYDTYAQGFLKSLDTPQIRAELKKSYVQSAKSIFSQNEVNAQLAFYGSVDGQNALKKQSAMTSTYLKNAGDASKSTVKNYEDKHLKKMQDDINKLIKK